jgi:hypothetical protein
MLCSVVLLGEDERLLACTRGWEVQSRPARECRSWDLMEFGAVRGRKEYGFIGVGWWKT